MLSLSGRPSRLCSGPSRREFLRAGGLAVGGLSLSHLLAAPPSGKVVMPLVRLDAESIEPLVVRVFRESTAMVEVENVESMSELVERPATAPEIEAPRLAYSFRLDSPHASAVLSLTSTPEPAP